MIEEIPDTRNESQQVFSFRVTTDGVLDYTVVVNIGEDRAYVQYEGGSQDVYVISETVKMEKLPDNPIRTKAKAEKNTEERSPSLLYATNANYIGSEPFEIDNDGNQVSLGTAEYYGYETMGCVTYYNPTESGYLQREAAGYTTFDAYRFTITAGTQWGTAVAMIVGILAPGGTSIAASIVSSLLSAVTGMAVGSVIDMVKTGTLRCREYLWNYRVRYNSNTGVILRTAEKYRYWWEMYDSKGQRRGFEFRNDFYDGFLLSNYELIGAAMGRIML